MIDPEIQVRIDEWLGGPVDSITKEEILTLMRDDPITLRDSFYRNLSFGTGGMRGLMGVGPNRMNLYTIQIATQGLANYLLKTPNPNPVFISYDSRHNSKEFAWETARVLAGNGIRALITFELRPTPFVSFGVRQKGCSAGIMITASHNPKEYNGYKVYWSDGGQVIPPHDKNIIKEVAKIQSFDDIKLAPEKSPLIEIIDPELDFEYLEEIHKLQFDPKEDEKVGDQLKITYTSLHGTGIKLVPRALKNWGFSNINLVDHQIVPDGNFPTVKSPNPENHETLKMGLDQMQNTLSDILIVTDPDADRMAIATLHKDTPYILNGNQIATICLEYICKHPLPQNGAAITTIVSTDLLGIIAKENNLQFFEVLTGFKYIGELIHKWEETPNSPQFLFGAEESYGYLIGTHSRDKDAVVLSCLIAEIALLMKIEGRTLVDFLEEIYKKYGHFLEGQKTLDFPPGKESMDKMQKIMDTLRKNPPKEILNTPVEIMEDYQNSLHSLPPANVLLFRLSDKSKIVVRPSGTEPKIKIYASVYEPTFTSLEAPKQKLNQLLEMTSDLLT